MMTHDLLHKFSQSIPVFGLVVASVFYSAQGAAYIVFDGPELRETLTIKNDSPETIYYSLTLSARRSLGDAYALSFSDNELRAFFDPVPSTLPIKALNGLVASSKVTFNDNTNGYGEFVLGDWSETRQQIPTSITFTIPFSRSALESWIDRQMLNQKPTEISFYAVGHGYTFDFDDLPDQSLGIPDSKRVTIDIKREDYAHISGLEDVWLPQKYPEGFCVSSTTEQVILEFQAANSPNTFQLQVGDDPDSPHKVGYNITLDGKKNNASKELTIEQPGVQEGHQWDAHKAGFTDVNCNNIDNMSLLINLTNDLSDPEDVPSGTYKDTITIIVKPV